MPDPSEPKVFDINPVRGGDAYLTKRAAAEDRAASKMQDWFRSKVAEVGSVAHEGSSPGADMAFGSSKIFGRMHTPRESEK